MGGIDISFLVEFFKGAMLPTILGLIALDILFGVWAALKEGKFDWKKVGGFYRSSVVPLVGAYLTVYIAFSLVPGLEDTLGGQLTVGALFASVLAVLGGSILGNAAKLGIKK